MAINSVEKLDKKSLIQILLNTEYCYQSLKEYDNCISYLEAVIYHFDGILEARYKIKLTAECNKK